MSVWAPAAGAWLRLWHSPTVTTWGSLVVRLASVLLVLPLVLVRFSPEEVAVWQLITALLLLGLMLDYGLAPTFTRLLSYARGGLPPEAMARVQDGRQTASRDLAQVQASLLAVAGTMRWLYPRLAWAVTLAVAAFGSWGLVRPIAQLPDPTQGWLAWGVVLGSFQITLWGTYLGAMLQGMDNIALLRRWEVGVGLLQIACCVGVLLAGGNLLELVATYQIWVLLGLLRNAMLIRRRHALLVQPQARCDERVLQAARQPAWRSLLGVLCSQGLIQLSGLYYAQVVPAAEVGAYFLALRLASVVSQFSQAPFYTKIPHFSQLYAQGRKSEVLQLAGAAMRKSHWVFVAGAAGATLGAPWILELLDSRTGFVPLPVFAVLLLAFFLERLGAMHIQLYSLTNHVVWHIANGVTALVAGLLTLLLGSTLGLLAFPLALVLAYGAFYCPYALRLSARTFAFKPLQLERGTSLAPSAAMGVVLAASLLPGFQH